MLGMGKTNAELASIILKNRHEWRFLRTLGTVFALSNILTANLAACRYFFG
jgi:hypothetical protein